MPYKDKKKRRQYHTDYMRDYRQWQKQILDQAKKTFGIPADRRRRKRKK